jgi:hypothetical protein
MNLVVFTVASRADCLVLRAPSDDLVSLRQRLLFNPPATSGNSDYAMWSDVTEAAGHVAVPTESYSNFGLKARHLDK